MTRLVCTRLREMVQTRVNAVEYLALHSSTQSTAKVISGQTTRQGLTSKCLLFSLHHTTQNSHLVRTQSLKILPSKPGVGQYIAIHATLTARDFSLVYFYPSGPFTCIFPKPTPIFPVLAVANAGSCVGPQNKVGHPVGCRFPL